AKAEQTWIDGRRYFDLETDRRLREEAAAERARLVTAVLRAPRPPAAPATAVRTAAAPGIAEGELGALAWRRLVDAARSFRHSYSGLDAWHECTEGEQQ
ncbi:MAG: hypothetical protein JNM33_09545, partial [Rubrivivax sp.]|nr:hypothetical protein [Rubrivivax sp.]